MVMDGGWWMVGIWKVAHALSSPTMVLDLAPPVCSQFYP